MTRSDDIRSPALFLCLALVMGLVGGARSAAAQVLTADTLWQGRVVMDEDVVVPKGITLTIAGGTEVMVRTAESTKIDPEYVSRFTELTVRGRLVIQGEEGRGVRFAPLPTKAGKAGRWAGIIVDQGVVQAAHCRMTGAENGVSLLGGRFSGTGLVVEGSRYGVIAQGTGSELTLSASRISGNDYGLLRDEMAVVELHGCEIAGNAKKDEWRARVRGQVVEEPPAPAVTVPRLTRSYGNETLRGRTVWRGLIRVSGQVRVAAGARLVVMPGTVVEFTKRDTNGDGIGENGILAQGVFWAKGTPEAPIVFRSAEERPGRGDWDAINILGSDANRNLVEFCRIENAYRGVHFHFSNVAVTHCRFRDNYRGMQFQESVVELRDNDVFDNKSAVKARDSEVLLAGNRFYGNVDGVNFLRTALTARDNLFSGNRLDGLRVREGTATVEGNIMAGNREGLVVANAVFGRFTGNLLAANLVNGLVLKDASNLEVKGDAMMENGLNGVAVNGVLGTLSGCLITGNGSRGVGVVSFSGRITGNAIAANGEYAIGLDGSDHVDAGGNWWGGADLKEAIYDAADEAGLGRVTTGTLLDRAPLFTWPVAEVPVDLSWRGRVAVPATVTVPQGVALEIRPGTEVVFARDAGMMVRGTIRARGTERARILFTSEAGKGPGDWWQIDLERAMGSVFENCDFEYASWGIHSHYTNLVVRRCRFRHNGGGIRFRSGPLTIADSLFSDNGIGLRAFRAHARVTGNVITNNEIGVFVREQGSGLAINGNTIAANERYNMRLGDFNDEDVNAKDNWWGVPPESVPETIFDGRNESYIGKVIFTPVRERAVRLDWAGGGK